MRTDIAGWTLAKMLGKGGMGQVWKAYRHTDTGENLLAVIKLPLAMGLCDDGTMRRWLAETRALMVLQTCSNVVRIYDAGVDRGVLHIVMEYVHGADLGRLLKAMRRQREPMKVTVAMWIAGEVLHALRAAHTTVVNRIRREIIHRDVAPKNVLVAADGNVKLGDFGIAMPADEPSRRNMGTELYMAPEHHAGRPTAKSDVFSWGVMLWEMLEGQRYYSEDPTRMKQELLTSKPRPLGNPEVPPELAAIVADALTWDEARRPTSSALLDRIERLAIHRYERSRVAELVKRYFSEVRTSGHTEAILRALPDPSPDLAGLFASADVLVGQGRAPDVHELAARPRPDDAAPAVPVIAQSSSPTATPERPELLRQGGGRTLRFAGAAPVDAVGEPSGEEPLPPLPPRTDVLPPLGLAPTQSRLGTEPMPREVASPMIGPGSTQRFGTAAPRELVVASTSLGDRTAPTEPPDPSTDAALLEGSAAEPLLGRRPVLTVVVALAGILAAVGSGVGVAILLSDESPPVTGDVAGGARRAVRDDAKRDDAQRNDASATNDAVRDDTVMNEAAEPERTPTPDLTPRPPTVREDAAHAPSADPSATREPAAASPVTPAIDPPAIAPAIADTATTEPSAAPRSTSPPPPPATVDIRLDLVDRVSVKIGRKRFEIDEDTRVRAPSGRQRVRWREPGDETWRDAGTIDFRADRRHVLRFGKLAAKGFDHRMVEDAP